MFTHSQRRRAVLEAMQRVLASVLVLQLLTGPVVQGHPHPVPECEQVTSTHAAITSATAAAVIAVSWPALRAWRRSRMIRRAEPV